MVDGANEKKLSGKNLNLAKAKSLQKI